MLYKLPHSTSPVFEKAKEIFTLSRGLSEYLRNELAALKKDGNENQELYITGDIIQQSTLILPEIIHAEQKEFSSDKAKHVASVRLLTSRIYKTCERLEKSLTANKDFVWMLRKEIKKFQKLQKHWRLTL